jgi:hypothetical protein
MKIHAGEIEAATEEDGTYYLDGVEIPPLPEGPR